ncbi:MAG TPA: hypothetical protein ENI33_07930 [Thermoplasmatales archaeon]|nr:hypothetical protein [Thermoplasmatales archaeon]
MKSLAIFIVVLFMTFGAIATLNETPVNFREKVKKEFINFSEPFIEENAVRIDGCANLISENKPVIPFYKKTYIYPAGTSFKIEISPAEIKNIGKINLPSSYIPVPPGYELKKGSYNADIVYPEKWYSYDVISGFKNGRRVSILNIYFYPLRYVAGDGFFAEKFELKIEYEIPEKPLFSNDEYDLLIICPEEWKEDLQIFKEHKESHGIRTVIAGLNEIYSGKYFSTQGRDDAEKIKYFIKDAIEQWGIKYVLLVGGRKPGIEERWYVPVRYVYVYWADEIKYISDLYFADIYDGNYNFSSWDTDGNNVFGEWKTFGNLNDEMDLYPDVYVGRWACRNKMELKIMIEKTVSYENRKASKRIVLAGGDNFDAEGIEGEIVCDKSLSYLPGFEGDKIYVSFGDVTSKAMKEGLNKGASFIHLHGHGSPIYWSTHKPGSEEWEDGLKFYDLPFFFNEEYPIAVIGGCHTAMFNVSITIHPWTGGIPAPEGLSWWFARKYNGGAIASLGYTAFPVATPGEEGDLDGDGINDPDCAESGYGYMQINFFKAYGTEGNEYLGECWGYAVGEYVEHFKIPYQRWHLHTIQSFVLLGDPSLKIGGY